MPEAGQGQLGGARTTPDRLPALNNQHALTVAGQFDRSREAVRPRADDDDVVFRHGEIQVDGRPIPAIRTQTLHSWASSVRGAPAKRGYTFPPS